MTTYRMLKDVRLKCVKVGGQWRLPAYQMEELLAGTSKVQSEQAKVSIKDLLLSCTQSIQDVFAEVAGAGSVTTDKEGYPLNRISNSCDSCKLILGSEVATGHALDPGKIWHNKKNLRLISSPAMLVCNMPGHGSRSRRR